MRHVENICRPKLLALVAFAVLSSTTLLAPQQAFAGNSPSASGHGVKCYWVLVSSNPATGSLTCTSKCAARASRLPLMGWRLARWLDLRECCPASCWSRRPALAGDSPAGAGQHRNKCFGYETQTSPLIRISPEGELISIDGLQRLKASSVRVGVQGFTNWQLSNGWGLSVGWVTSARKRSPGMPRTSISGQPRSSPRCRSCHRSG
jgi:hypothetical protein